MKRREALKKIALLGSILPLTSCVEERGMMGMMNSEQDGMGRMNGMDGMNGMSGNKIKNNTTFNSSLAIPKIEPYAMKNNHKEFNFNIQNGVSNFVGKKVATYGVNAEYLGTTLRVKSKDLISLRVKNSLDEATTSHWHGWHVEGENDGSMHQAIAPNKIWNPKFVVQNRAGTYFYHAHTHGKTGEHVYKGIAGMIIVDDDISESLDIPKEYGVDDIPLIVQDKVFTHDGDMPYTLNMPTRMHGYLGNTYMVNGVVAPIFKAFKTLTRFRILNASNARIMKLGFSDKRNFYQIATDGGFMEKPLSANMIRVAPAERVEVLVDLSDGMDDLFLTDYTDGSYVNIMKINAKNAKKSEHKVPKELTKIKWIKEEEATKHRNMVLSMGMGGLKINHKTFSHSRIDERVKINTTEIWTIKTSSGPMAHPFHIHGTSFQILSRNGKSPLPSERGWKDIVLVDRGEEVRVIMKFDYKADDNNPYMYHCHILEHEDMGMMGQFSVV